jgi:hypothetical protein
MPLSDGAKGNEFVNMKVGEDDVINNPPLSLLTSKVVAPELKQTEEGGEVTIDVEQGIQINHPFSKVVMQAIHNISGKLMRHEKGTKVDRKWLQEQKWASNG